LIIWDDENINNLQQIQFCQSPSVIREVKHLHGKLLRGNSYRGEYITQVDAKKLDYLKSSNAKKVEGLTYDISFPDFNPNCWPTSIGSNVNNIHLILKPEKDGGQEFFIDVHRFSTNEIANQMITTCEYIAHHRDEVRDNNWGSVGKMFPAGYQRGYNGKMIPYVMKDKSDPNTVSTLGQKLSSAGKIFADQFGGRKILYNEMMSSQSAIWPKNKVMDCPSYPMTWMVSIDLGNPMHVDSNDGSYSYACWFTNPPQHKTKTTWLLFPEWGVAIQLSHGTWISWNGKHCAHCSSVPREEIDNFHIYSLFTSQPKDLCQFLEKKIIPKHKALNWDDVKAGSRVSARFHKRGKLITATIVKRDEELWFRWDVDNKMTKCGKSSIYSLECAKAKTPYECQHCNSRIQENVHIVIQKCIELNQ
jgi:hypothetical protein